MGDEMGEYDLYGGLPPFEKGSATSLAAALSVAGTARAQRELVFRFIASMLDYGSICDEAERRLNLPHQSCSPRFRELAQAGRIVVQGKRKTASGKDALVWVLPVFQKKPAPVQLSLL